MGDTICTPLYQLLKQRGVKFEFFRRVTRLEPTPDGNEIGTILIDRQVELAEGLCEYDALTTVKGFECWPSSPRWEQIKDGELLAAAGYNFENTYGPPLPPVSGPELRLQLGRDFDTAILAIPVGALHEICQPLMVQRPAWADMIENLPTVRTQALQLWLGSDVKDLGGPYCDPLDRPARETMGPIVTTCEPPFDTYSEMSQLLPAEAWGGPTPLSIAYFCAVMADDVAPNDASAAADKVKGDARDWMTSWLKTLWVNIGGGEQFRWDSTARRRSFASSNPTAARIAMSCCRRRDRSVTAVVEGAPRFRCTHGKTGSIGDKRHRLPSCWRRRGGQLAYLRPQFRMAPTIGPRSRPFSVSTYSARGGLIE
jgi:hypothetical protein